MSPWTRLRLSSVFVGLAFLQLLTWQTTIIKCSDSNGDEDQAQDDHHQDDLSLEDVSSVSLNFSENGSEIESELSQQSNPDQFVERYFAPEYKWWFEGPVKQETRPERLFTLLYYIWDKVRRST